MDNFKVVKGHLTDVSYDGKGDFCCSHNKLTSLEGSPEVINEVFECSHNQLTTLKGCPKEVNGNFNCTDNPKLEDISDLSEGVKNINLYRCPKIKVFPKHIKDTLKIWYIPKPVLNRLKKQKHLEIVEENKDCNYVIIREIPIGQQLLGAI